MRIIGYGSSAVVFEAIHKKSKKKVAIKKICVEGPESEKQAKVLARLCHPNVLPLIECFYNKAVEEAETSYFLNLVTPLFSTDLLHFVRNLQDSIKGIPKELFKLYFYQMARSLVYLEAAGLIHGNVEPSNFLVEVSSHKVVLAGFGNVKRTKDDKSKSLGVRKCYLAPEILMDVGGFSAKSDIWALGCSVLQIIMGNVPFSAKSKKTQVLQMFRVLGLPSKHTLQKVYQIKGDATLAYDIKPIGLKEVDLMIYPQFVKESDPYFLDLLTKIFDFSPKKRISGLNVLLHPYFSDIRKFKYEVNGKNMNDLLAFTKEEIAYYGSEIMESLALNS